MLLEHDDVGSGEANPGGQTTLPSHSQSSKPSRLPSSWPLKLFRRRNKLKPTQTAANQSLVCARPVPSSPLLFVFSLFVRVYGSGHAGSRQNAFDDFICSEVERMDCLSFVVMQEGGAMHGRKWMSVGNDRMVEMLSLHSIYSYVLSS